MRKRYLQKMRKALEESRIEKAYGGEMQEVANAYYQKRLMQRVIKRMREGMNDIKEKARYSRMMNVMVAWKCFVKEKRLLNKYLNECNF